MIQAEKDIATPVAAELLSKLVTPEGIRTEVIHSRYIGEAIYKVIGEKLSRSMAVIFWYGMKHPSRGRRNVPERKQPVDVKTLVEKWVPEVVKLTLAHDKDDIDEAEAALDELLTPLLAAPVKQLRQFYKALTAALKADRRVPMVVWRTYEEWGAGVIDKASDEEIKTLKEAIAREIVELCEKDAREQLPEAIVRALMWRPAERLQEVKTALKQGGKARMVGKESCLYLEITPKGKRKPTATVML